MEKLIMLYLKSLNNRSIDVLYKHVNHLDVYAEQFAVAALVTTLGSVLVYLAGCITSGNPWILSATAICSVLYGINAIASVDTLVLKEWRHRAWVD